MIPNMFLNKKLSIFSMLKTTGDLIILTFIEAIPTVCTQTAFSQVPQQKQILTCDLRGHPSCHSTGYAAGLVNKGISCASSLLNWSGNTTQVDNYCSGYRAAQQQLQQQK